tara:strand:+ start:78 stop:704 length:627 start_codon:yes stop_codon:yes gene_type:complete
MTSLTTETPAKYAVLMETNGEECESWLYFIKHDGNEDKLQHLLKQLEQIEMYIIDDLSTFDLDLEHLVSEQTAKEMTKIELNSVSFHRKFDGVMKTVNLGLKRKDSNEKRIRRAHKALGFGNIDEYIEDEDIDTEDQVTERSESEHDDDEDLVPLPLNGEEQENVDEGSDNSDDSDEEEDKVEEITQEMAQAQVKAQPKKKRKKKKRN